MPTVSGWLITSHNNKMRFALVKDKKFKYFKDEKLKKLVGVLDFDQVHTMIIIDDDSETNISGF